MDTTAPSFEQINALLIKTRRMLLLRTVACFAALGGLILLWIEIVFDFFLSKQTSETYSWIISLIPVAMILLIACIIAVMIYSIRRYNHLGQIAELGEKNFSQLGLRLSASLEAPKLDYCTSSIRNALWLDTLSKINLTPWKRWTGTSLAVFWVVLFLLCVLFQIAFNIPSLRETLLSAHNNIEIKNLQTPFHAKLEVTDPGEDQWATKIESIPLKIKGESPLGFNKLRLSISVNGETPKEFPLDQDSLPKNLSKTAGTINLDELEVQDYDVISYNVVGDAIKPEATPLETTSDIYFVQIRPFKKDTFTSEGQGSKCANILYWLIEEERRTVRGSWFLKTEKPSDEQKESYVEAGKMVTETQRSVLDETHKAYTELSNDVENPPPPEILTGFDRAAEQMTFAQQNLEKQNWSSALQPEQQALATLVDLLHLIHEQIGSGEGPEVKKLKDRQIFREKFESIAQQQKEINKKAKELQKSSSQGSSSESEAQKQELAKEQKELAQKTAQESKSEKQSKSVTQQLSQAKEAMEQSANAMTQGKMDQSLQEGQKASDHLQQALAEDSTERESQLASDLHKMLTALGERQNDLKNGKENSSEIQNKVAEELSGMNRDLKKMFHLPGAEKKDLLNDPIQKTGDAAKAFSEIKGTSETLIPSMESLAQAYEQAVGRETHLTQLQQELGDLKKQMQGVQQKMNREEKDGKGDKNSASHSSQAASGEENDKPQMDGHGSSPSSASEWFDTFDQRKNSLTQELYTVLGGSNAWKHWEQTVQVQAYSAVENSKAFNPSLADRINALSKLQTEIEEQLQSLSQLDTLRAMQNEDIPPEYRELVSSYFERLSRETNKVSLKKTKKESIP